MTNYKTIYTRRIAYELKKIGFPIVKVEVNPNKPEFDCYVFEESTELIEALLKLGNR